MQWAAQNEQHAPYRIDLGRFWFWFEFYIDLNNRSLQALVEAIQHPWLDEPIRPRFGTFPQAGEWEQTGGAASAAQIEMSVKHDIGVDSTQRASNVAASAGRTAARAGAYLGIQSGAEP